MSIMNKTRLVAAVVLAAVALGVAAPPAGAKTGVRVGPSMVKPGAIKLKVLKQALFMCKIGRASNFVIVLNHNAFAIPKGAKFFYVAGNSAGIVSQGWRTLSKTLVTNQSHGFAFSHSLVAQNGKPTGCRAYVRWYA